MVKPRRLFQARGAAHGDGALLHALEQRGLSLGRRAIDLIGQQDMGEDRPLLELEVLPAIRILDDNVGPDDVRRHQVRGELDAREGQVEPFRERLDQQGLA